MKKAPFKVIAESILTGKFGNANLPTSRVDYRRLTIDEIKEIIKEEFVDAKKACDVKPQEFPGGWGDAELEQEIDWAKSLKLKEFFEKK